MINPIPGYLESNDKIIYDVDYDNDDLDIFYKQYNKLALAIGRIIIIFNLLERAIEDCLLECMNSRGEDVRVWILIGDMSFDKKSRSLEEIYKELNRVSKENNPEVNDEIREVFKKVYYAKDRRNLYAHLNWYNNINCQHFESKVKYIKSKQQYLRLKKKVDLNEIREDFDRVKQANNALIDLHNMFF